MADKLKRFLVLGSASSTYIACHERQFTNEMLEIPGIDQLVLESKEEEIVQILTMAAADVSIGLTDSVALAHATSLCIKSDNFRLRQLTYQALTSICLTSDGLFRVLECLHKLTGSSTKKVGMWGKGLRKALTRWYALQLSHGQEYFATMLISEKARYGWTHCDVLKLIHFRAPTPEVDAIIQYFVFERRNCLTKLSPELQNLANKTDELKNGQDGTRAAALLAELKILPYAMPPKFHRNHEVWAAYIQTLPLRKILNRLEFLTTTKNFDKSALFSRLDKADPEDLDAGEIMMYLSKYNACNYNTTKSRAIKRKTDEAAVEQASGFADGKEKVKKTNPKLITADPTIVTAVNGLLLACLDKIPNVKLVWTFLLNLKAETDGKCSYPHYLQVSEAVAYSMQYLQCTGQVFYFANNSLHSCPTLPSQIGESLLQARKFDFKLLKTSDDFVDSNSDAVVFVSDSKKVDIELLQTTMTRLREKFNKPEMKLVIMLLTGNRKYDVDDKTLVVCGWDERSLRLINHFVKGGF